MPKKYSVVILDMFHYQDPEHEYEINGFSSLDHAQEYARRRVRDSLEDFRDQGKSDDEIGGDGYQFGEDAVVIGGNYAGASELEFFIQHPATTEERDWQSIEPNEEAAQLDESLVRFKEQSKRYSPKS